MALSKEELKEFETEAEELLDSAEAELLALEEDGTLESHYDAIFRVYHSLKGAAGMMELRDLQVHMHQLENRLSENKKLGRFDKPTIDFLLRATDSARQILLGRQVSFSFDSEAEAVRAPAASASAAVVVSPPKPPPAPAAPSKAHPTTGRVLLVDDEVDMTDVLADVLTQAGFEVKAFNDARLALKELASFQPDVVVSDINMPDLNGVQFLKELRETHFDLPLIFISGCVTKNSLLEAVNLDVYGVLEKPFNPLRVIELTHGAAKRNQLTQLLSRSINLLMYQFSDLDQWLAEKGKDDVRKTIRSEIANLVAKRDELRNLPKKRS